MNTTQLLRFQSAYVVADNGCWTWTRALDNGYGRFWLEGRNRLAHAVSYEHHVGPIPARLQIDHLCRNRACVRWDHLEAVPLVVNVLRGEGLSARNLRKEECLRGHALFGDNLYVTPGGSRSCRTCQRARMAQWRARSSA